MPRRKYAVVGGQLQMPFNCNGSSKVSRARVMLRGVRAAENPPGVFHCFCAGLGVMLTKSERSNGCPGVVGKRLPPPGVVIIDDGRARSFLDGGVDGGSMRVRPEGTAGEGDAAR